MKENIIKEVIDMNNIKHISIDYLYHTLKSNIILKLTLIYGKLSETFNVVYSKGNIFFEGASSSCGGGSSSSFTKRRGENFSINSYSVITLHHGNSKYIPLIQCFSQLAHMKYIEIKNIINFTSQEKGEYIEMFILGKKSWYRRNNFIYTDPIFEVNVKKILLYSVQNETFKERIDKTHDYKFLVKICKLDDEFNELYNSLFSAKQTIRWYTSFPLETLAPQKYKISIADMSSSKSITNNYITNKYINNQYI